MDVRAADTSILAAKRLELEKIRPVTQKSEGVVDQRQAVKSAVAAGDNTSERKPEEDAENELIDDGSDRLIDCRDNGEGDNPDERHVLDVRV